MRPRFVVLTLAAATIGLAAVSRALLVPVVPTDYQVPGTQPLEVSNLDSINNCSGCHGGYDPVAAPHDNWQGGMMAHALRDPLFWAAVAITEQDLPGVGDLCIRCHSPRGWLEGNSTPTDGSALTDAQADGIECDVCHSLTNPDDSEWIGVQYPPFVANDGGTPPEGFYGSGAYVLSAARDRLGPYTTTVARHRFQGSSFHRQSELCGTCHDVSNPATGDLAHNNGAFTPLAPGTFSGVPNAPVDQKAAFNNPPYSYGVVERTFSEHQASAFATMPISDYANLPEVLQDGAIEEAYEHATLTGPMGNYEDGTIRTFSCQACHMSGVVGKGCDKNNAPLRTDMPRHDLTGGNTWTPQAIQWLDTQGRLLFGGGLTTDQIAQMDDARQRALEHLEQAATVQVVGDRLRVFNLTGHKLPSGFPEGRRMWLRIRWLDGNGAELRVDGEYGAMNVTHRGAPLQVETLLDLHDSRTRVYEAKPGVDQGWAAQLLAIGLPSSLPMGYDRMDGAPGVTLGQLAASTPGTIEPSFRFALNNALAKDNRIPAYGTSYDEAVLRNTTPVPLNQYGSPGTGETYDFWDELMLDPPAGAMTAEVEFLYQTTSWEYVQFLDIANDGSVAHLAGTGTAMFDAWRATGMSAPLVVAESLWCAEKGTGEDLEIRTRVDDDDDPTLCKKTASGGDQLTMTAISPEGTFNGAIGAIVIELFPTGSPPISLLPGVWVDRIDVQVAVVGLPPNGLTVGVPIPSGGTGGVSLRIQGVAVDPALAANGLFAISDAHDVELQ